MLISFWTLFCSSTDFRITSHCEGEKKNRIIILKEILVSSWKFNEKKLYVKGNTDLPGKICVVSACRTYGTVTEEQKTRSHIILSKVPTRSTVRLNSSKNSPRFWSRKWLVWWTLDGAVSISPWLGLYRRLWFVCKLPISDHVMLSREFFLYVSENYSFIFTQIYRKLPLLSPGLIQVRKGFWVGL